jgi:hypothetical protein
MPKKHATPLFSEDDFRRWRSPVHGNSNPERLTNPVWQWLVETKLGAYQANEEFGGRSASDKGPGWCFDRFGQSRTMLADGRVVFIAGEHEDHYDPDFHIYNDVTILSPVTGCEILGYPIEAFPPTDFHSATLIGSRIVIVGNLSYPKYRRAGHTQVLTLDITTWEITRIATYGESPGWLHGHQAELSEDGSAVLISGGLIDRCDDQQLVENIDDWRLSLDDWQWERLTNRRWPRFEVHREDRRLLHLWHMEQALFSKKVGWDDYESQVVALTQELGGPPLLELVPELYRPRVPHEVLREDHRVHRIRVGDVVVRYVEDGFHIQVTVEGELPAGDVEQLRLDLIEKLTALERGAITSRDIVSF